MFEHIDLTRRAFLQAVAAVAAKAAIPENPSTPTSEDTNAPLAGLDFIIGRHRWAPGKQYFVPRTLSVMLPQNDTDQIYESLELDQRHPHTLNKDTFFIIAQKAARLANLYFSPTTYHIDDQEREFADHSRNFFQKVQYATDFLNTDFVASLLMFQVSGEATANVKKLNVDLIEERIRAGLGLVKNISDIELGKLAVNILRSDALPIDAPYFPMPRLDGPVTLGIHDLENSMIAEGLLSLERALPAQWESVATYIQHCAPGYFAKYRDSANSAAELDARAAAITKEVYDSNELQGYLMQFKNSDYLQQFLTTNGDIDVYQFIRSTVYWATINEMSAHGGTNAPTKKILEDKALEKTLEHYLSLESGVPFFLDQINNPKMLKQLESDAKKGDTRAKKLLDIAIDFMRIGDKALFHDRSMSDTIAKEKIEQNMDFQVLTGVTYARHLLDQAYAYSHGDTTEMTARYQNPNELAFDAFLANGLRENAALFLLAGTRPLHRATVGFLPPQQELGHVGSFIDQIYVPNGYAHPQEDFRAFLVSMRKLDNHLRTQQSYGINNALLEADPQFEKMAAEATDFGVFHRLIVPPHNSWMRAIGATTGYIGSITK